MTSDDPAAGTAAPHDVPAGYCGHCGGPTGTADHSGCRAKLVLEPPRFCSTCRRRMKVQVTPRGWSAECVEHGARGV